MRPGTRFTVTAALMLFLLICSTEATVCRGGAILGTRNLGYRDFFGFTKVELREGKDGFWLPMSAELREAKDVYKITFKRVEINQELPENTFVLDFDPGAQVWDKIHNVKFIAGGKIDGALKDDLTRIISDVEDTGAQSTVTTEAKESPATDQQESAAGGGRRESSAVRWTYLCVIGFILVVVIIGLLLLRARR